MASAPLTPNSVRVVPLICGFQVPPTKRTMTPVDPTAKHCLHQQPKPPTAWSWFRMSAGSRCCRSISESDPRFRPPRCCLRRHRGFRLAKNVVTGACVFHVPLTYRRMSPFSPTTQRSCGLGPYTAFKRLCEPLYSAFQTPPVAHDRAAISDGNDLSTGSYVDAVKPIPLWQRIAKTVPIQAANFVLDRHPEIACRGISTVGNRTPIGVSIDLRIFVTADSNRTEQCKRGT